MARRSPATMPSMSRWSELSAVLCEAGRLRNGMSLEVVCIVVFLSPTRRQKADQSVCLWTFKKSRA
jgi:hypothetical protein